MNKKTKELRCEDLNKKTNGALAIKEELLIKKIDEAGENMYILFRPDKEKEEND